MEVIQSKYDNLLVLGKKAPVLLDVYEFEQIAYKERLNFFIA